MAFTAYFHTPFFTYVVVFLLVQASQSMTSGNMQVIGSDVAPPHLRGQFFGIWQLIGQVASLASPAIFAFLAETSGYTASFVFLSACALTAAFVLATQAGTPPARFLFEEGAGLVPVDILKEDGKPVGAELTAPQPLKKLTSFSAEDAAACVSLSAAEIRTDRHRPQIASVGMAFLVAELASRDALRRAKPEPVAFSRVLSCDGAVGVYIYTRDVPPAERPCDLQARMFFPGSSGLTEDPATGSATVAAAALLADLARERDGELKLRVGQGVDMGRPSLLLTRVRKENGAVASAHVGGACVQMMEGTFRLEGDG